VYQSCHSLCKRNERRGSQFGRLFGSIQHGNAMFRQSGIPSLRGLSVLYACERVWRMNLLMCFRGEDEADAGLQQED